MKRKRKTTNKFHAMLSFSKNKGILILGMCDACSNPQHNHGSRPGIVRIVHNHRNRCHPLAVRFCSMGRSARARGNAL